MKRILLAASLLVSFPALAADEATPASPYTKDEDRAAYSIGYTTAKQLSQHVQTLNVDAFMAGFRDMYAKKTPALTEDEMRAALETFRQKLSAEAYAKAQREAEANKKKSQDFLATNAKKKAVKTTKSGLQYEVLKQTKGPKPKPSDTVKVHYEGKLIDGSVFDSSVARGEPASFRLDQVIPGWTEALQLMSVGSKYRVTLPPALGYGEQGAGPIPANAALIFEVELLGIEPPSASEAPAEPTKSAQ